MTNSSTLLRRIPKVDLVLDSPEVAPLLASYPRGQVVRELRGILEELRREARRESLDASDLALDAISGRLGNRLERRFRPYYRRVVNATGVILHTGLGRAPLPAQTVAALSELGPYPQRVEIDLETGQRGGRDEGCARLLTELTGAEAATVVNNNAAATLVILAALARGTKVLLSRGEMVEIGGSYRIPDIMHESGATLVDVGTTNRTHEKDYRNALDEETGLILKVHTSNYRVVGFTCEVEIGALVEIGREAGVPVVHDLGSGCLIDLAAHGRPGEHTVQASVEAGADLVCFSGDKLLGGPQAGLIVGKKEAVDRCRRHPLFRAMRPGRLVYTALEATLRLYLGSVDDVLRQVPALGRLVTGESELRRRARSLAEDLADLPAVAATAVPCESQAGSGSLPARDYPSWAVSLVPEAGSVEALAAELRRGEPAILARLRDDALLLDVRTLEDDAFALIGQRLRQLFPGTDGPAPGSMSEGGR